MGVALDVLAKRQGGIVLNSAVVSVRKPADIFNKVLCYDKVASYVLEHN